MCTSLTSGAQVFFFLFFFLSVCLSQVGDNRCGCGRLFFATLAQAGTAWNFRAVVDGSETPQPDSHIYIYFVFLVVVPPLCRLSWPPKGGRASHVVGVASHANFFILTNSWCPRSLGLLITRDGGTNIYFYDTHAHFGVTKS